MEVHHLFNQQISQSASFESDAILDTKNTQKWARQPLLSWSELASTEKKIQKMSKLEYKTLKEVADNEVLQE